MGSTKTIETHKNLYEKNFLMIILNEKLLSFTKQLNKDSIFFSLPNNFKENEALKGTAEVIASRMRKIVKYAASLICGWP